MRRIFVLLISFSLFAVLCAYAGEDCDSKMKYAINLLRNGQKSDDYRQAKELFIFCFNQCGDTICADWIRECDDSISADNERLRLKEERIKKEIGAIEAKKRTEQRKRDGLVYLSVYSDVPGRFRNLEKDLKSDLLKTNIHFTNEPLKAYWFVHVTVSIFDESSDNESQYRIYTSMEVENATESDPETKNYSINEKGCCDTEINIANMLYDSKNIHLYSDIRENVLRLLGKTLFTGKLYPINNPENIVICVLSSISNNFIEKTLETRLNNNFNNAVGDTVIIRDELLDIIKKEYDFQAHEVGDVQKTLAGHGLGADKFCIVEIAKGSKDELHFYCSFIDMMGYVKKIEYPRDAKDVKVTPCSFSDSERIRIVADVLSKELGLLKDEQIANLESIIKETRKKDETLEQRVKCHEGAGAFCSFFPGLYQFQNNKKLNGSLIIAGEALSIGGIIVTQKLRNVNIKKMNSTTNVELKRAYADKANTCTIIRDASIGAAVAVYVWNLVDAWTSIHKQKNNRAISLNPVITDESVVLSLSINF